MTSQTPIILVLVLFLSSYGNAFHRLLQKQQEFVYNYQGLIVAHTDQPEEYASEFFLHGKLHIQVANNLTYFTFTDLKYKIYNGIAGNVHGASDIPIHKDIHEDLYKTFVVDYDNHGKVKHFYKSVGDRQFSVNIKKSVASIFQINKKSLNPHRKRQAFSDKEHNIHGVSNVKYNVQRNENVISVKKYEELDTATKNLKHITVNAELKHCQDTFEDPMFYEGQKEYVLFKKNNYFYVHRASSTGGIYLHPFKAKSEAYYVYTNVTFTFDKIIPNTKLPEFHKSKSEHLEYKFFNYQTEPGTFPDVFQERRKVEMKVLTLQVLSLLNEIVKYLDEHHIHTNNYDFTRGQVINDIQNMMMFLNTNEIKAIWEELEKTPDKRHFEVYQKLLTIIGTEATVTQIINVATQKRYENNAHIEYLLQNFPLNIKTYSMNLLKKAESFLNFDPKSPIGKAGILAFGSLVYKTCRHTSCKEELIDKYVNKVIDKIDNSKDTLTKMIYFGCLYNMEFHRERPYFVDSLKNEDNQFSLLSMWGLYPLIQNSQEKIFKLYYPIFTDANIPTHQRIFAYYLIMKSNPGLQKMWMIHWQIQKDANHAIYQFYYKYLYAMANTNNACLKEMKMYARQLLRYTHPPSYYGLTGFYTLDFTDEKYGSGKSFDTFFVLDKHTALLKLSTQYNFFNKPINPITVWIKVQGMEAIEKIALITSKINYEMFNFEEVIKTLVMTKLENNAYVEVFLFQNDKVSNVYYFKNTALPELIFFNIFKQIKQSSDIAIMSKIFFRAYFPTEIGFPVTLDWMLPAVSYSKVEIERNETDSNLNLKIDAFYKIWMHSRYGLSFYNSITDVWQGIQRLRSFDCAIPLLLNIGINKNPSSISFKFDKHNNPIKSTGGYRNHVTSITFVKDELNHKVLQESSPNSQPTNIISKGREYRRTYPDGQLYFGTFGYDYSLTVYDSERKITNTSMKKPDYWFLYPKNTNWNPSLSNLFKLYMQKWDRLLYQPFPATYGIIEKWEPSTLYPSSHQFTFSTEYEFTPNTTRPTLPGIFWKINITTLDYYAGEPQISSEFLIKYKLNEGHHQQILEIQNVAVGNNLPASPKLCILVMQKWEKDSTVGYLSFSQNPPSRNTECTQEGTILAMTMQGFKSEEQKSDYAVYGECDYSPSPNGVRHKLLSCYNAYDTFRNYTFDISLIEEPDRVTEKIGLYIWELLKTSLYDNYKFVEIPSQDVEDGHFKIALAYPLKGQSYNIHVITKNHEYQFEDLENMWISKIFGLKTEHTSFLYKVLHNIGLTKYCSVYNDTVNYKYHARSIQLPKSWTLLAGADETTPYQGIYAKQLPDYRMALQLIHNNEELVIIPSKLYKYDIKLNNEEFTDYFYSNDWFYYRQIPHTDFVTVIFFQMGAHLYYDGTHVHVDIPKMDFKHYGLCYSSN